MKHWGSHYEVHSVKFTQMQVENSNLINKMTHRQWTGQGFQKTFQWALHGDMET